jgi:hypothetical protein
MKPSLRNLFMKKLTRDRVVPTRPANVLLADFGNHRLRFAFLPEVGQQQKDSC